MVKDNVTAKRAWWEAASHQIKLVDRVARKGATVEDARALRAHSQYLESCWLAYRETIVSRETSEGKC